MRSLILVVPLSACVTSTFVQHQAAFVPRATPLTTDGQAMQAPGELALGASNLGEPRHPTAGDPDTGDAVPAVQLRGSIAGRVRPNVGLYFVYEHGLASTAIPVQTSDPKVDNGDVTIVGFGWSVSIETSTPGFRVGIANELSVATVPWIQYTTCTTNCSVPGATDITKGTTPMGLWALAVVPSYKRGRFTVFGGVTARNQLNVVNKLVTDFPMDPSIDGSPFAMLAHAGAAIDIVAGIRASVIVHKELIGDPVHYGPGFAAMLSIPLGRRNAL